MKSKNLWLLLSFIIGLSSAQLSCRFAIDDGKYVCFLTIQNSDGFDNFTSISGAHLSGYYNYDVIDVKADGGNSPIFPQIICRQFSDITGIVILRNIGLQKFTELSFANCHNLWWFEIDNNFITEIGPGTFRNNVRLYWFGLKRSRITTLPEDLFAYTRFLDYIEISNTPTLSDLPANIFKDLNRIRRLHLFLNRLMIWRPEWTQKSSNLVTLGMYRNFFIPEIPRNAINSKALVNLWIDVNFYRSIDYFSFNDISSVVQII